MLRHWRCMLSSTALIAVVVLLGLPSRAAQAQTAQRCFSETGFCVDGRIREFWEANGGLPVFGFPIGPQQQEQIEGKPLQVQRFERNRLELHPENQRPYDVLLGRLGADRLAQQGRDWYAEFPKSGAQGGCRFFGETGHNVCTEVLTAWRANGLEIDGKTGKTEGESMALFGLPLSDLHVETMADGQQRQVQWFERARFELHPENQPPYNVLLGLLGNEIRDNGGAAKPAPVADQCADVAEPVSARIRPAKCFQKGTNIEVDVFGFNPNEQIGFWISAPDGSVVGTRQTLNIGPQGGMNGIPFQVSDFPVGRYSMVFQGVSSGHQSIVYFKILGGDAKAPAPAPAPGNIPVSQNASVSPNSGARGTTFRAAGTGFKPGEMVGVYITAPDQSVYGAPFQVQADGQGNAGPVTFGTNSQVPTGVYAMSFEGVESRNKAIGYFAVTP